MATTSIAWQQTATRVQQFYRLTKPKVVSLIVFTAFIGMFLAVLIYTFWPGNKKRFERAARLPLEQDPDPNDEKDN